MFSLLHLCCFCLFEANKTFDKSTISCFLRIYPLVCKDSRQTLGLIPMTTKLPD